MEVTNKMFIFVIVLLVLIAFFKTITSNLLLMYLFFEIRLIPTFLIVLYWGDNWERLKASFYLLMYIIHSFLYPFISLPLLIYIMI